MPDEFGFVLEFLLAVMMSHFARSDHLQRVLQIDWVRRWNGWSGFERDVDGVDSGDIKAEIAAGYVQRFVRLVLQNVDLDVKSDEARLRECDEHRQKYRKGIGARRMIVAPTRCYNCSPVTVTSAQVC